MFEKKNKKEVPEKKLEELFAVENLLNEKNRVEFPKLNSFNIEKNPNEAKSNCYLHEIPKRLICLDEKCKKSNRRKLECSICHQDIHMACKKNKSAHLEKLIEQANKNSKNALNIFSEFFSYLEKSELSLKGETDFISFILTELSIISSVQKLATFGNTERLFFGFMEDKSLLVSTYSIEGLVKILREFMHESSDKNADFKHLNLKLEEITLLHLEVIHSSEIISFEEIRERRKSLDIIYHKNIELVEMETEYKSGLKDSEKETGLIILEGTNSHKFERNLIDEEINKINGKVSKNTEIIKLDEFELKTTENKNVIEEFSEIEINWLDDFSVENSVLKKYGETFLSSYFEEKVSFKISAFFKNGKWKNREKQEIQIGNSNGIYLIKSGDIIAGGYSDKTRKSEIPNYLSSENSFLFSSKNKRKIKVKNQEKNWAIYKNSGNSFGFGKSDIFVSCNPESFSNFSCLESYEEEQNETEEKISNGDSLFEFCYFVVEECEIYEVI